ncbi:M48 family metalloprotease [Fibrella forsythiae]|uniref:M48 family metalloprotease n=1 Tax=Fibrella forsythiae TaxID=2817061 RepID=A0ABS3JCA8_9BACT|nr:M48 family metalloprotease [Fibrella forsythiae]MBO0947630.1 M48 family metalloprotease [Fibrella forsythiae]
MKSIPTLSRLVIASVALLLTNCARNPVTGKREISLMSTEQEIAIGKESHPSIVATMGLYEDTKLQAFMNQKGKAMAAISHRPELPYQFFIVDSPVVNAFAVPGGYVYFTRGILAHFNNEAEFAGVLGHEIGHITARHSARQQTSQILTTGGAILGAILIDKSGGLLESAIQGAQLLQLKYSRAHESESDEIGVGYSSKIGYDANQMAEFFATIKRIQDNSGQSVPNMMSTHPDPGNRFTKVHELAKDYQAKNPGNYQVNREAYLRMIDGLLFGEDPKQGFVENNAFYHPELKFQFPVPAGWQHQNAPSQFQMGPKDGKSSVIMMLAKGNSLDEAAQTMVKELNLKVLENSKRTVNGNQALALISQQLPQQQQGQPQQQQTAANTLQISTYLIQYNNLIYAIHGLSSAADFERSFPTFRTVSEGFRSLTDPDKLNRKPDRVYVRQAPRAGTFQEVMSALNMPTARIEELGVLNSLKADSRVEKGTMLKIISK